MLRDRIFIKRGKLSHCFFLDDILYLEAKGAYTIVHTTKTPITVSTNLSKLSESFTEQHFVRCHRSYFVNLKKVEIIEARKFIIAGRSIPVSHKVKELLGGLVTIV
jgi:DNA-binding LytR/AlgR family response regulator